MATVQTLPRVDSKSSMPRYMQTKRILIQAIRQGLFIPGEQLPNTNELSHLLNVSLLTAHRAVQELVEEGWVRRQRGRGTFVRDDYVAAVKARPQFRLGLVLRGTAPTDDLYHGSLLTGIHQAAWREGTVVEKILTRPQDMAGLEQFEADGLICFHPQRQEFEALERVAAHKCIVVLGASTSQTTLHCVDSQNREGSRAAVRHLIDLGHRRIAILNGPLGSCDSADRLDGCVAELHDHGLRLPKKFILPADRVDAAGAAMPQLANLLRKSDRPTAVFVCGYLLALDTLRLLQQLELAVPRDVSLVGFDDSRSAGLLNPPLTTVRQPLEEMGQRAFDRTMCLLKGEDCRPRIDLLPTSLVVRGSTGPAPAL